MDRLSSSDENDSSNGSEEGAIDDMKEVSFADLKQLRKKDNSESRFVQARISKQLKETISTLPKKKRENKDAPIERSSKVYVSRYQRVVASSSRPESKDPRFEGELMTENEREQFRTRYSFIDKMQDEEIKELKTALKKEKNEEEREKLQYARSVMESRRKKEHEFDLRRKVKAEHNREQRQRAEQGKSTYFLKEDEIQRRTKTKKFEELSKSGRIDKYLSKKRKRIESKERKNMPFKRPKLEEDD